MTCYCQVYIYFYIKVQTALNVGYRHHNNLTIGYYTESISNLQIYMIGIRKGFKCIYDVIYCLVLTKSYIYIYGQT